MFLAMKRIPHTFVRSLGLVGGLWLCLNSLALAAIPTVGVYDETGQANAVDRESAANSQSLAQTKTDLTTAFDSNVGGVWNFDTVVSGEWDTTGRGSFTLSYGTAQSQTITFTIGSGKTWQQGTAAPISGSSMGTSVSTGDKVFTPSKPLTLIAFTQLYQSSGPTRKGQLKVKYQDNTTASTTEMDSTVDTFHVLTGTGGNPIVEFTITCPNSYTRMDDLAFIVAPSDSTAPTLDTKSPADGSTVAVPATLTATFSEAITKNTSGSVTIENLTLATSDVIAIGSANLVVSGSQLTITPSSALANSTHYAVKISSDAIKDSAGNFFGGIADSTTWDFTTEPALGSVTISGTFTVVTNNVNDDFNLSQLGKLDWAYWHEPVNLGSSGAPTNSKAGASAISNVTPANGGGLRGSANGNHGAHDYTFRDGVTPGSGTVIDPIGILENGFDVGDGILVDITLPKTVEYTIHVWVSAYRTTGRLTASINGAVDYVDTSLVGGSGSGDPILFDSGYYQLTVRPSFANDVLTLRYDVLVDNGTSFVVLSAVAVQPPDSDGTVFIIR